MHTNTAANNLQAWYICYLAVCKARTLAAVGLVYLAVLVVCWVMRWVMHRE